MFALSQTQITSCSLLANVFDKQASVILNAALENGLLRTALYSSCVPSTTGFRACQNRRAGQHPSKVEQGIFKRRRYIIYKWYVPQVKMYLFSLSSETCC